MEKTSQQSRRVAWLSNALFLVVVAAAMTLTANSLWSPRPLAGPGDLRGPTVKQADEDRTVQAVDAAFQEDWSKQGLTPAPAAPSLQMARRLSLALMGTVPSLPEIRALEALPEKERMAWWVRHLEEDPRSSDYLAERLARICVGVEKGPLLLYRRMRLVAWLSDALQKNQPYDQIVRSLIDSNGIWTTKPGVNFVTVTIQPKKGPDEARLAARVTRAFLATRIDCVQCHDGKLGSPWKQKDFHQLAAFFAPAEVSFTGLHDNTKREYKFRYLRQTAEEVVPAVAPWAPELMPADGSLRERLADWVTAEGNRPFARAIVNRMWALLFNRPLISPVDDIPQKGPFPPGLEILADDFTAHHCDLQRLIRIIVSTRVFQLDSRSSDPGHPPLEASDQHWAAFPLTRLRPEQMAGSVIQASSLTTLDAVAHVLFRIKDGVDEANFVKRFGDFGDDEFSNQGGTIPQRLLLMNGDMVRNYTAFNPFLNASSRIGLLAPDDASAVESAYLAVFSRRPSPEEAHYFADQLHGTKGRKRLTAMGDLYWTLFNATEFSWNH